MFKKVANFIQGPANETPQATVSRLLALGVTVIVPAGITFAACFPPSLVSIGFLGVGIGIGMLASLSFLNMVLIDA